MKKKIIFTFAFMVFGLFSTSFVFADTTVNLQIKTNIETIYDSDITVTPCDSEGDGILKATPYCALVQSGTPSDWAGLWVNSINNIVNNDNSNGAYWMWLANLNINNTNLTDSYNLSSKQYILQENDNILFYYNTNPLDMSVDNENPKVGENIKITGKELGLDSSWNPLWNKVIGGKVVINGEEHELNENSEFLFEITNGDSLSIKIKKENFIDSREATITPEKRIRRSSGSRVGSYVNTNIIEKSFSLTNALSFLSLNQKSDGSFGEQLYTDWVAIGIAKAGNEAQSLKDKIYNYLKNTKFESSIVTDNERHAMALMSLGINPYNGTEVNYINKVISSFDGTQIGDQSLYNDDIFSLIVLSKAGYVKEDEIISKVVSYVISKQSLDGSWDGVDMTSASIQALSNFKDLSDVNESISKAESYLLGAQTNSGDFGNISSTSWAIQALSLNKSFDEQIDKAIKYLSSTQQSDGGLDKDGEIESRMWSTSYTVPATLKLSWNDILESFEKKEEPDSSPQDEVVVYLSDKQDTQIKDVPTKIIKKENIIKNENEIKLLNQEEPNNNLLSASAIGSNQNNNSDTFFSVIYRILQKIRTPFVWLWVHLGF